MKIGKPGLKELDLVIAQSCSFTFSIIHKDDQGNIFDYSNAEIHMVLQPTNRQKRVYDFSDFCIGSDGNPNIVVTIPYAATSSLPLGDIPWDLIVVNDGVATRIAYGTATVVDTYALDGRLS